MADGTTHLERLAAWIKGGRIRIDPDDLHGRWAGPLLPTRRFGPDCWATFHMATAPAQPKLGEFLAWVAFDARSVGVVAYLERPLADTFGVVTPFAKPAAAFPGDLLPALGAVGQSFLDGDQAPDAELEAVRTAVAGLEEGYKAAVQQSAPDFFGWLT